MFSSMLVVFDMSVSVSVVGIVVSSFGIIVLSRKGSEKIMLLCVLCCGLYVV